MPASSFHLDTSQKFLMICREREICDECGKAVIKDQMQQHKRSIHGTDKVPCEVCGKVLKHPSFLKHHMEVYHIEESMHKDKKILEQFLWPNYFGLQQTKKLLYPPF